MERQYTKNRIFLYKLLTRFNKIPKNFPKGNSWEKFVKSKKTTDTPRVKIYFKAIITKYIWS